MRDLSAKNSRKGGRRIISSISILSMISVISFISIIIITITITSIIIIIIFVRISHIRGSRTLDTKPDTRGSVKGGSGRGGRKTVAGHKNSNNDSTNNTSNDSNININTE